MGQKPKQLSEKQWTKEMVTKFLGWRQNSGYSGPINVYEVARFCGQLIAEVKEIYENKTKKS